MSEPAYQFPEASQGPQWQRRSPHDNIDFLHQAAASRNIAAELPDQIRRQIVSTLIEEVDADKKSMHDWLQGIEGSMKLALMVMDQKTFPWAGASNVKLPLIMKVALKFAARAYAKLLSGKEWVKTDHPGLLHADGEARQGLSQRAKRVGSFMNWQLQHDMEGWEEEFDLLLHMLPWVGCLHKKTYFDSASQQVQSELVLPTEMWVNQGAKRKAHTRYTHKRELSADRYHEMVNSGDYLPVNNQVNEDNEAPETDRVNEYLEVHGFWDLDGDGYREPYVFTIHVMSHTLCRMVARFDPAEIRHNNEGQVQRIPAIQHFTKYGFYPAPDGSYWSIGWGHMLRGLNEAGNSLANQLIDAGTLQNANPGVVNENLRLVRGGKWRFKPAEWKRVRGTMGPLSNSFFPIPVGQPSAVLFSMLEKFDKDISELAMTPEMVAERTPANAPVGTTLARLEEAERVSNAVDKRIYKSMSAEFKVMYWLNGNFLDPKQYAKVLNLPVQGEEMLRAMQADFESDSMDIVPTANPEASSRTVRIAQMDFVISTALQFAALDRDAAGQVNATAIQMEAWDAAGIEHPERFLPAEPTEEQQEMAEMQQDAQEMTLAAEVDGKVAEVREQQAKAAEAEEQVRLTRAQTILAQEQAEAQRIENQMVSQGVVALLEEQEAAESAESGSA